MASSKKAKRTKTMGGASSSSGSSSSSSSSKSSSSSSGSSYVVKDTKTGEVIRTVTNGVSSTPSKSSSSGGGSSSSSGSLATATQAVNLAVQKLVEQKQAEEKSSGSGGGTVIPVQKDIFGQQVLQSTTLPVSVMPETKKVEETIIPVQKDIFGQQVLQSTTLPVSTSSGGSTVLGPVKEESFFKQPAVSEPESITVQRGQLAVSTSNLPTDEKSFLLETAKENPSAFSEYQKGTAEVTKILETSMPTIIKDQTREVQRDIIAPTASPLSSIIKTPDDFMQQQMQTTEFLPFAKESITEKGFISTGEQTKTTLTLQPKGLDAIKKNNEDMVQRGQDFLEKTGLKTQPIKDVTLRSSEDVLGQRSSTSSILDVKKEYTPTEEIVLKSFADYENTNLKQEQLNKQILEFNARPATQQDEREFNALKKAGDDLSARYRMNPFVKTTDKGFMFESPIQSEVLAQQVSISQRPDVFVPYGKVTPSVTENSLSFVKGYKEGYEGKLQFNPEEKTLGILSRGVGTGLGAVSSTVMGEKVATSQFLDKYGGKLDTGIREKAISGVQRLGVEDKEKANLVVEKLSSAGLQSAGLIASYPVGVGAGGVIERVAPTTGKVLESIGATKVLPGAVTTSKYVPTIGQVGTYGMGGLAVADVGLEGYKGYKETGSVAGGALYATGEAAVLGAMAVPVVGGIKGFREGQAARVSAQGDIMKSGEGVNVVLSRGTETSVQSPLSDKIRFASESEGLIKVQGGKDIPIKIYTGAEGRPTVRAPELPQEGVLLGKGKIVLGQDRTRIDLQGGRVSNQQLPEEIFRIQEGGIKVEFPGSKTKPLEFKQDIDYQTLPSERIQGKSILYDKSGKEYVGTSITERFPGKDDSALLKTLSITQDKTGLKPKDVVQIGESVGYQKTPQEISLPEGTIKITETDLVSGTVVSKPQYTLTQTLRNMVGKLPGQSDIPTVSRVKSPIGSQTPKVIDNVKIPLGSKTTRPATETIKPTETVGTPRSGALQQELRMSNKQMSYPVSETQKMSGLSRLKQIIGEREALKFQMKAQGIREQPLRFGQVSTPVSLTQQLKSRQQEQRVSMYPTQIEKQRVNIQDQAKLREYIQVQTPKKIQQDIVIQEESNKKTETYSPINQNIEDLIRPTGLSSSKDVISPEKIVPFLGAGAFGLAGGFGSNTAKRYLAGVKINPIGAISKGMGKGIRGIK